MAMSRFDSTMHSCRIRRWCGQAAAVVRGYIFVSVDVRGTLDSQAPDGGPLVNELFGLARPRTAWSWSTGRLTS